MVTRPMKKLTLTADARLIEAARQQAASEHTTLDAKFREWLAEYTQRHQRAKQAMASIEEMCKTVRTGGRKFTREEMNER